MATRSFKVKNGLIIGATTEITSIVDEDNMASDSATALSTQQAIKAYVDSNAGTAWQSVITADPSNAVAGKGYFCNTTSAAFTVTLPTSATIGDEISFMDYAGTFDTNNLTIGRNSHNIQGSSTDLTVATERAGFTLVYVDATQGWLLKEK